MRQSTQQMQKNPVGPLGTIWRHRSLLWQFTLRYINVKHKGSYLGLVWQVLSPLLMFSLYTFVFGILLNGRFGVSETETSADYALGIFLGFTLYGLIADTMGAAPGAILDNVNLVKKVVFPLEVLPASIVLSAVYNFLISMVLFAIGYAVWGPPLSIHALWLPVILFPLLLLSLGLGWLLAGLGAFFRDVQASIMFINTALFYTSGIFYAPQTVPADSKAHTAIEILRFSPLFRAIELSRDVLLWQVPVHPGPVIYIYVFSIIVFLFGFRAFCRMKPGFADVL